MQDWLPSQAEQRQAYTLCQRTPWPAFPTTAVGSPISFRRPQMSSCTASKNTYQATIRTMMIRVKYLTCYRQPAKSHSLTRLGHPRKNGFKIKLRERTKGECKNTCKQDQRRNLPAVLLSSRAKWNSAGSRAAADRDVYPLRARPRRGAALQASDAHTCTKNSTESKGVCTPPTTSWQADADARPHRTGQPKRTA